MKCALGVKGRFDWLMQQPICQHSLSILGQSGIFFNPFFRVWLCSQSPWYKKYVNKSLHFTKLITQINSCFCDWCFVIIDVIKLKFYERSVTNWPHQQQTKSRKSLASRESSSVGILASIKCTQSISRDTKGVTYFDQNICVLLAELTSRVHVQNIAIIHPCLSLWLWDYKRHICTCTLSVQ